MDEDPVLAAAMAAAGPLGSIDAGKVSVDTERLAVPKVAPAPPAPPAIDPEAILASFRAIVAQMTPTWREKVLYPTASVVGAAGTLVCVCWLTLLTLGSSPVVPPGPVPLPPVPPPDIAFVQSTVSVEAGHLARLEVVRGQKCTPRKIRWKFPPGLESETNDTSAVATGPEGVYTVLAYTACNGEATDLAECVVTVGKKPPDPGPTPDPTPTPTPAPIRVLMIYDGNVEATKGQKQAMNAKVVTDYLNARCLKGPDGKTPEWRVWEKSAAPLSGSPEMLAAFQACKGKPMPYLAVDNGKDHAEMPIPGDATAEWMVNTLAKYGGK